MKNQRMVFRCPECRRDIICLTGDHMVRCTCGAWVAVPQAK